MPELELMNIVRKAPVSRQKSTRQRTAASWSASSVWGLKMKGHRRGKRHTNTADLLGEPNLPTTSLPSCTSVGLLRSLPTAPPKMIPLGSSWSAGHGRCFFTDGFP